MFFNLWLDKEDMGITYMYNGILSHKKGEILPFAKTLIIDLESIVLSKTRQKRIKPSDFTHMWDIKEKATNE